MPQIAGATPQVKLTKQNARKLKLIAKKTRRTITQEVNVAVETYVPQEFIPNGSR